MKRVALDFSWPLNKVWKGFINPYAKLMKDCPACTFDKNGPRGYSPDGYRYFQEWYGYVAFDAAAYGAKPVQRDNPRIRELAARNVNGSPEYYMTPEERKRERENLQKANVDLMELYKTTDELKAELDKPVGPLEELEQPGLVRIDDHRTAAIEREIDRLYEVCFRHSWMHQLKQEDVDALVTEGRLWDFVRVPRDAGQAFVMAVYRAFHDGGFWMPEDNGYRPTADEVNDWGMIGMGHDSINSWVCMRARAEREGVTLECSTCGGKGYYWPNVEYDDLPRLVEGLLKPDQILALKPVGKLVPADVVEKLHEEWESYEPPEGPGYQLWETTSEGSPITPVFKTLDELCAYCAENCSTFGSFTASKEKWREMLDEDFVRVETDRADGGKNLFM